MSGEKPREIAVEVLGRCGFGEFVEDLLDDALARANLPFADRRLCQELVYGIVRWQAPLDWLIARKTADRPQKPALRNLLRLGLYQIFWLSRIPNHAAVHVTVELAKHRGFGPQAGFVNALLRGYLREFEPTRALLTELQSNQPALGYSHPEWLVERWQKRWEPKRVAKLLNWNNVPPKTFARINTLKIDPAKLLPLWRDEDVEYDFVRRDWFPENIVFELKSHPPLDQLLSFQQGFFYVQDPSTLLAVHLLDPQPGETILDLCAAPGGKLTYMAQLMKEQGRLVAHDVNPERLRLITANCARLGVVNAELGLQAVAGTAPLAGALTGKPGFQDTPAKSKSATAAPDDGSRPGGELFDRILVDAPCSNTGVMRRRVDLRWRVTMEEIKRLCHMQVALLDQAALLLKPGGSLVYSTCSLEPEENRQVVDIFLGRQPQFKLECERELLPFTEATDGAYVARVRRA